MLSILNSRAHVASRWRYARELIWLFVCGTCFCQALNEPCRADAADAEVIDNFVLRDARGREYRLADVDAPIHVIAFLGTECPLAKLYAPRLVALARRFDEERVAFWGIDANRQDSIEEIEHFARRYGIEFPLLRDPGNRVADLFSARRTPEVFVLDDQRRIRYRGRIDDQYGFYEDGRNFQRPAPSRHDLAEAITSLLENRPVERPETTAYGCLIGRVGQPDTDSPVTWSEHVAPIFQRRCQTCHREGEIAPFPLISYEDVQGWEPMIGEVVSQGRMPPWHADAPPGQFANDARLSETEKEIILTWVEHGGPQGDSSLAPAAATFTEGWQIGEPDRVIYMSDEAVDVPPAGVVEYRYYVVDPQFHEDRWIRAAEARPGNSAVVHHVNVFVLPPELGVGLSSKELAEHWELQSRMLCGFVPGTRPVTYPAGTAKRIPAGSRIVFQLHYTPDGTPQTDRSYIGLLFADPDEVRREATTVPAMNCWFTIPPNTPHYEVELWHTIQEESELFSFLPHMHLRGKSFLYEAHYPDGTHETLLNVPQYDFNWQNTYVLAEPKQLPAGTRIRCVAVYDNSAENLSNPNPNVEVRWGEQTWDEMMIGYFDVVRSRADDRTRAAGLASNIGPLTILSIVCVAVLLVYLLFRGIRPSRRPLVSPQHATPAQ